MASSPPPPRSSRAGRAPRRLAVALALATAALGALATLLSACSGDAPLPGDPLRLATGSLPDPVLGERYREDVVAVGGLRPYTVRLEEGELPPGLSLQGGVLLGTPTELGRFEFTLAVSDANLASTFESYQVTVRDVPVPRLSLAVPDTEVRDRVELRGRVEEARGLRAMRIRLEWEEPGPALPDDAVRPARDDVAVFWRAEASGVSIDLAILGEAFDGEGELFRLALDVDEPSRLGMDLEVETLYADRHDFASRRLGASPAEAGPSAETSDEPSDEADDGADAGANDQPSDGDGTNDDGTNDDEGDGGPPADDEGAGS